MATKKTAATSTPHRSRINNTAEGVSHQPQARTQRRQPHQQPPHRPPPSLPSIIVTVSRLYHGKSPVAAQHHRRLPCLMWISPTNTQTLSSHQPRWVNPSTISPSSYGCHTNAAPLLTLPQLSGIPPKNMHYGIFCREWLKIATLIGNPWLSNSKSQKDSSFSKPPGFMSAIYNRFVLT